MDDLYNTLKAAELKKDRPENSVDQCKQNITPTEKSSLNNEKVITFKNLLMYNELTLPF